MWFFLLGSYINEREREGEGMVRFDKVFISFLGSFRVKEVY